MSNKFKVNKKLVQLDSNETISEWFLTVNTNKAPKNNNDEDMIRSELKDAIAQIGTEEGLEEVLKYMDEDGLEIESEPDVVKKVNVRFVTEKGKKLHRIHAHFRLTILHEGRIHLNKQKLDEFIVEKINDPEITSVYTHWIFNVGKSFTINMEKYMLKDI